MKTLLRRLASVVVCVLVAVSSARAQEKEKTERDIFDYAGQKAATGIKKIVFAADTAPHGGRGNHEFLHRRDVASCAKINTDIRAYRATVLLIKHWPGSPLACRRDRHPRGAAAAPPSNPAVKDAIAKGAGFMAIHYGVETEKGERGKAFLDWMGGYFETFWSVNPHWQAGTSGSPQALRRPAASSPSRSMTSGTITCVSWTT